MGKKKKWRIILLSILLVLILLLFAIPRLFNINRYKPYISDTLSEKINRKVEIENLGLSLIRGGSITAEGFRIKDPHTIDENILSVPHARFDIAIIPLFSGIIEIKRIVLTMPVISIIEYPDGSLNIDGMANLRSNVSRVGFFIFSDSGEKTLGYGPPEIVPAIYTFGSQNKDFFKIKTISIHSVKMKGGILSFYREDPLSNPIEIATFKGIDLKIDTIPTPTEEKSRGGSDLNYNIGEGGLRHLLLEMSAEASLEISKGSIKETPFSHLFMRLSKDRSSVKLEKLDLDIFSGNLSLEGVLYLRGKKSNAELKIGASGMRSNEVLNTFSKEEDLIVGDLEITGDYTFPISSKEEFISGLDGKGDISITDGYIPDFSLAEELADAIGIPKELLPAELDSEEFDYMGGKYYIGSEKVFTDKFAVITSAYDANASGYMGFNKALNFAGEISPRKEIRLLTVSMKDLAVIPFTLKGTADDVEFSIDIEKIALQNIRRILKPLGIDTKDDDGDIGDTGNQILKEIFKK